MDRLRKPIEVRLWKYEQGAPNPTPAQLFVDVLHLQSEQLRCVSENYICIRNHMQQHEAPVFQDTLKKSPAFSWLTVRSALIGVHLRLDHRDVSPTQLEPAEMHQSWLRTQPTWLSFQSDVVLGSPDTETKDILQIRRCTKHKVDTVLQGHRARDF